MTTMPLVTATEAQADYALMRAMLAGDGAAFETLYRKYQAAVYRFALLRSGSADTACDIVQDVFMGLMTGGLKFDPLKGALGSFLVGVARNFLLKRDEAQGRFVSNTRDDGEDEHQDADPSPSPLERVLANEAAEKVRAALAALAPHYRDVAILYEMHDLSYVEIAQVCNIDIGTVRSRLNRARAKLVAMLMLEQEESKQPKSQQREAQS
jgi:RNA polymerase sigma-70 factor (ECF subfamily)